MRGKLVKNEDKTEEQLIEELRKINPGVKVIAVSGLTEKDKLAKVDETLVHVFLTKPYTAEKLLNIVHDILNTK